MQRRRNHSVFGRNTRKLGEAVESSPSPCKLDHGGLEPNAIAIYEEVMYRMLPLIHSSQYEMIENGLRGGMTQCSFKKVEANNKHE